MITLYLLIVLGAVAIWFLLSGIYRPLGRLIGRIYSDAKTVIKEEEKKEKEKEK